MFDVDGVPDQIAGLLHASCCVTQIELACVQLRYGGLSGKPLVYDHPGRSPIDRSKPSIRPMCLARPLAAAGGRMWKPGRC